MFLKKLCSKFYNIFFLLVSDLEQAQLVPSLVA